MDSRMYLGMAAAGAIALFTGFTHFQKQQNAKINDQIKSIFKQCTSYDDYKNCNIDLSTQKITISSQVQDAIKAHLLGIIKSETGKHMLTVKISTAQTSIFQPILDAGFAIHNSQPNSVTFRKCLQNHDVKACWFPSYHTALIGITAVVFNQKLDKVLLVKEKYGKTKQLKPVTGVVESQPIASSSEASAKAKYETLVEAAAREVEEETRVKVKPEEGMLVGLYAAKNPGKGITDLNFTWAFTSATEAATKGQESEIDAVAWENVQSYISVQEDKPWVMRKIVQAAHKALEQKKSLGAKTLHFSSGAPITYYSAL